MSAEKKGYRQSYLPQRGYQGSLVIREAVASGLRASVVGTAAMAGLVGAAHAFVPAFRNGVNLWGKAVVIAAGAFGSMMVVAETELDQCYRHPERYSVPKSQRGFVEQQSLDLAETFIEKPLRIVGLLGAGAVGTVAYRMFQDRGVSTSIKVMHTRVVGQASVVALLLAIMASNNWTLHAQRRLKELEDADREQGKGGEGSQ